MASTLTMDQISNTVGIIWDPKTGESLICHACRNDMVRGELSFWLDQMCSLVDNETRTCSKCHEQQGIWWHIDVLADHSKGAN